MLFIFSFNRFVYKFIISNRTLLSMDKFVKRKKLEESDDESDKEERKRKRRKYDPDYIAYGFTAVGTSGDQPLCVVCLQTLSNEGMKPAKLKRHLTTMHPDVANKPKEYFERQKELYLKQKGKMTVCATVNEKALRASYLVALRIARSKKPHTIGEELILPAAVEMCEVMLGKACSEKLKTIPLSDNTINRRIGDMSEDIRIQLIARLQQVKFAIQLDESTDISNAAHLLVYVRYCWDGEALEDFLFCKAMAGRTTGEELFHVLDNFFVQSALPWTQCIGICTDGAAAMTGKKSGLVARIKQVAPEATATHCMIHREALAAKGMDEDLADAFSVCVKIVNFIKARPLNHRLFENLCSEMGAEHKHLLLHTEVRWLSRGRVVQRVFELRDELLIFLNEHNGTLAQFLTDETWVARLAYLGDIFSILNSLNLSLQGPHSNALKTHDKIDAFQKKLRVWKGRCEQGVFDMFPLLDNFLTENEIGTENITSTVLNHIQQLSHYFHEYFGDDDVSLFDWIRNPFQCLLTDLTGREQEELAELSSDRTLQLQFSRTSLSSFWLSCAQEYPLLSSKAVDVLLPFSTTYLCEKAFSAVTAIKTKYRARLDIEDDVRVCLSRIEPRLNILCSDKQAQPSH